MKTLKTDSFGVLSEQNTMSKYWGVSAAKNGQGFTVRFQDSVSKETINFKPKSLLSEQVAAVIARGFYEDRNLYSNSIEFTVDTQEGVFIVNCCSNTINLKEEVEQFCENVKKGDKIANNATYGAISNASSLYKEIEDPEVKEKLDKAFEEGNSKGYLTVASSVLKKLKENLEAQVEAKPARDIVAELREIRRQAGLIGKRIDRLEKALKEAA